MVSLGHVDEIFRILRNEIRNYQVPVVELYAKNRHVFHVLISCVLSLRTRDEVTAKVCEDLFMVVDAPKDILKMGLPALRKKIRSVNFYKTKARNIYKICQILEEQYAGKVPMTPDELLSLPNVGRKTMGIVMTCGHMKEGDYIPADTHVHKAANRLGWVKTRTPEQTERELMNVIPRRYWFDLNKILVTFGQGTCMSVSPFCSRCPIAKYCPKIGVKRSR